MDDKDKWRERERERERERKRERERERELRKFVQAARYDEDYIYENSTKSDSIIRYKYKKKSFLRMILSTAELFVNIKRLVFIINIHRSQRS